MSEPKPDAATSTPFSYILTAERGAEASPLVIGPRFDDCPECSKPPIRYQAFVTGSSIGVVKLRCENGHEWDSKSARVVVHPLGDEHRANGDTITWTSARSGVYSLHGLRVYTEEPAGPLEVLVMSLARELHDREHVECDWFGHNGSSVAGFCRRACEARGLDWKWVYAAIERERLDEKTEVR